MQIEELDPRNIQVVANSISFALTFPDDKLLEALSELRKIWVNKDVWREAARTLTKEEVIKLNKMVILQNIANGNRVPLPQKPKPKPKRRPISKEMLAKVPI